MVDHGKLRWSVIHLWPNSAASIETAATLPIGNWQRVTVTYDGSSKAAGLRVYLDGIEVKTTVVRDTLHAKPRDNALEIGSRTRDAGFRNGSLDEIQLWRTALTAAEVAVLHGLTADSCLRRCTPNTPSSGPTQATPKLGNTSNKPAAPLPRTKNPPRLSLRWNTHRSLPKPFC